MRLLTACLGLFLATFDLFFSCAAEIAFDWKAFTPSKLVMETGAAGVVRVELRDTELATLIASLAPPPNVLLSDWVVEFFARILLMIADADIFESTRTCVIERHKKSFCQKHKTGQT